MSVKRIVVAVGLGAILGGAGACVDRVITAADSGIMDAGGDDVGDDVGDDAWSDTEVGGDLPVPVCPQIQLGMEAPVSIAVTTSAEVDGFLSSCDTAAVSAPDVALGWSAPADGRYVAYTTGSDFAPLVTILDGGCDGAELVCSAETMGMEAAVQVDAYAGQPFTIVVDGLVGGSGNTTLFVELVDAAVCPDSEIQPFDLPAAIEGESTTAPDRGGGSCGGFGGPDRLFAFTPEIPGTYGFEVSAGFDPVLYLQDGVCTFAEIACNDDIPGTLLAGLGQPLETGQTVTVGVDSLSGFGGPFTLFIDRLVPEACPAIFLGSEVPVGFAGFTTDGVDSAGSSCGGWATRDQTFQWTAPEAGSFRVSVDSADFDWVLSVFDGTCDGQLLGCRNAFESAGVTGSVVVSLEAGQPIAAAIDGIAGSTGSFSVSIDRFEGCDAIPLPGDPPVSVFGSTVGEPAENAAGCAPTDDSPEVTYLFVPPTTGQYRIDTIGSSFDTVLYVRASECLGLELACDDDTDSDISSEVVVDLVAGQPVYVFVDGYGGDAGPYTLNISAV